MIVDEGLLPKRTYTYKAYLHYFNNPILQSPIDSSAPLLITTMDTTSRNWVFSVDTLGDGGSLLRDCAIINDTTVIAVGEINVKDSLGNWINPPYNMARWNGFKWELIRVKVKLNYGTSVIITDQDELKSVFAFDNDVWFVSGAGGVTRLKNGNWIMMDIPYGQGPGGANKMWGTSSNNIYFVASNGLLTHFNGGSAGGGWRRLESGTSLPIQDIWGSKNKVSGEWEILAIASNKYLNEGKKLKWFI